MPVEELRLEEIRMRDPFILEPSPGEFVLFGTTDENVWAGAATGFDCYVSDDLEHWKGPLAAFRPRQDFWADSQFWAPEVHSVDGRFFMLATFATSTGDPPVESRSWSRTTPQVLTSRGAMDLSHRCPSQASTERFLWMTTPPAGWSTAGARRGHLTKLGSRTARCTRSA